MKWFGKSWGAPVCEMGDHVEVPVGEPCGYCHHAVRDGDAGLVLPFVGGSGAPTTMAYHHPCFAQALGFGCRVHILKGGFPLCGFRSDQPSQWPGGHTWVSIIDPRDANCYGCREKLP